MAVTEAPEWQYSFHTLPTANIHKYLEIVGIGENMRISKYDVYAGATEANSRWLICQ